MAGDRGRRLAGPGRLLLGVYRHCLGGVQGGGPTEVVAMVQRYLRHRPLEGLGMLAAAGCLTCALAAAFVPARRRAALAVPGPEPRRMAA